MIFTNDIKTVDCIIYKFLYQQIHKTVPRDYLHQEERSQEWVFKRLPKCLVYLTVHLVFQPLHHGHLGIDDFSLWKCPAHIRMCTIHVPSIHGLCTLDSSSTSLSHDHQQRRTIWQRVLGRGRQNHHWSRTTSLEDWCFLHYFLYFAFKKYFIIKGVKEKNVP